MQRNHFIFLNISCGSFDSLNEKIDGRMPPGNSTGLCRDECARDTATYILEEFN